MIRFRDQKRKARRDLHQRMLVPAFYYPVPSATPVPCNVRVHTKDATFLGRLGNQTGNAERIEVEPKIIFLIAEVPKPRLNGVVSVEPGEAYRIQTLDPVDDITVTARVTRLGPDDAQWQTLAAPE